MNLKPASYHLRLSKSLFEANQLIQEGKYNAANDIFSALIENEHHPVASLNRAICYLATGLPHLGVVDALRAYMLVKHIVDEGGDSEQAVAMYLQIRYYFNHCQNSPQGHASWLGAPLTILQPMHQNFKLAQLSLQNPQLLEQASAPTAHAPTRTNRSPEQEVMSGELWSAPIYDLLNKAMFRLAYSLSKCGRGPAYSALQLLDSIFTLNDTKQGRYFLPNIHKVELRAVGKMIEDLMYVYPGISDLSADARSLTTTRFSVFGSEHYGFIQPQTDYDVINKAISKVDNNAIVSFATTNTSPDHKSLVATQDVYEGGIFFTEFMPFVVSTANTQDPSDLATTCDNCGAELKIPSPFAKLVLSEETKLRENQKAKKLSRQQDKDERGENVTPTIPGLESDDSEDDIDASSLDTPPRGKVPKCLDILDTCNLQVCRHGHGEAQENFSFCSDECHDLAMSTYHDSICGTHIEDYLRKTMLEFTHPSIPTTDSQRLTLLLLVRILAWAYATSTNPIDLPAVQLLSASPRHPALRDSGNTTWSYFQNVHRPMQILQAMDGRAFAPKTAKNINFSDGRVLNTLIKLIQRSQFVSDTNHWHKEYDEEGYCLSTNHCQTPETDTSSTSPPVFWGRLHPLCDLVPIATNSEDGNVEFVDVGDGRIICIPLFSSTPSHHVLLKDTPLLASTPLVRLATCSERNKYARKYEGEEDVMEVDDVAVGDGVPENEDEEMLDGEDGMDTE